MNVYMEVGVTFNNLVENNKRIEGTIMPSASVENEIKARDTAYKVGVLCQYNKYLLMNSSLSSCNLIPDDSNSILI